jgi:hypothetical protein
MKLLTPLLLIVISIGIYYWVINPNYIQIGELRAQQAEYKAALDRAQKAVVRREELVRKFNTLKKDDTDRLVKLLPDYVDPIRLVVDINALAAKYGVGGIQDLNAGAGTRGGEGITSATNFGAATLSFTTAMTYDNFLKFLADLQKSLKLTDIASVNFDSVDTAAAQYKYGVTLRTYWLK